MESVRPLWICKQTRKYALSKTSEAPFLAYLNNIIKDEEFICL